MTVGAVDVAVVGAGVVGAAVARRLGRARLRVALLEAGPDVGAGTSKANTAILHTGFDATPGTAESRLVARGHALLSAYAAQAGIPVERTGALLVAWTEEQHALLPALAQQATANGYERCDIVDAAELYRREPHLGPGAVGALSVPDESLVCPWTTPLAYATEAVANGVALHRSCPVTGAERAGNHWLLATPRGGLRCHWVVNAAGLRADDVERCLGHEGFTVTPRRGQLIVFDKLARPLVRHILLPVPTARSKGVLVSPTVFGNVLLGPTAEDLDDKTETASTEDGIFGLLEHGRRIVPALLDEEVTAVYAGLRAATEQADYRLAFRPDERTMCLGGIRSTGLTSSLALAEWVAGELAATGVDVDERPDAVGVRMPNLGDEAPRPYLDADRIAADPEYGRIVCHCERVTAAEIRDACESPVPPADLDGLRRRTRALMGRCQGFYCTAEVVERFARHTGRTAPQVLGLTP
ncbi:MAG TPA: NAD(P)/FAD-dependent oxidoreductase [Acidimicrobiales bacterium]|nr:NAD(P)/FAD-dependent oxidoreductase [Acidimicrobiales bacterium]